MIHECNINCKTMDLSMTDSLGIDDPGKWLPFIFDMEMIEAIKMTTDDIDEPLFNCSTVFTHAGDAYIVDTSYKKLSKLFIDYKKTK